MTNREFFENIVNRNLTEEVVAHAKESIEKLDKRNATRSSTMSKTQKENEELKKSIIELFGENDSKIASEVAELMEISTQKASALLRQLVADEVLTVSEVKIPKKGKVKSYSLV